MLKEQNLSSAIQNLETVLTVFLSRPVSSYNGEQSMLLLKFLKSKSRLTVD